MSEVGIHEKRKLDVDVLELEKSIGFINCCDGKFGDNLDPVVRDFLKGEVLMGEFNIRG